MGDSYRETIKKNSKRIKKESSATDNREKAARRTAIRKFYARKSRLKYSETVTQLRLIKDA